MSIVWVSECPRCLTPFQALPVGHKTECEGVAVVLVPAQPDEAESSALGSTDADTGEFVPFSPEGAKRIAKARGTQSEQEADR